MRQITVMHDMMYLFINYTKNNNNVLLLYDITFIKFISVLNALTLYYLFIVTITEFNINNKT